MNIHHNLENKQWEHFSEKGVFNIIIRPKTKPSYFINILLPCRYHQNRNINAFPQTSTNGKSVYSWQHQIKKNQIKITA